MSAGSKSRLAKAAGAEVAGQSRQEKWHAAVARSRFQVKMYKTLRLRSTFGSSDVQKWPAAVARSTFSSQNVQNTPAPDHFLKFRCGKIAHGCGEKHIFKSKCTKHIGGGALFELWTSKNCTPLWREAHFEVKILKT